MATDDEDYLLALKLQEEFNREAEIDNYEPEISDVDNVLDRKRSRGHRGYIDDDEDDLNITQNLVHPQWETLDPTPDAKALFNAFDNKFFQGRLKCVDLEWSKRMYSCAGICYTRRNRLGMAITIRLSEPLLKLRSRKDLIETLLHEMIHAYCGVLGIREGNGGHGPYFRKIMNGINKVAGTNITVYHSFHDEVNAYKTHWWRCNGICQHRSPFFGYVKRTSNRAPGPNDIWWRQHLESCGGTFLKIKEPEKKLKNEKNKENLRAKQNKKAMPNIKNYFTPNSNIQNNKRTNVISSAPKTTHGSSGGGSGNLSNVVGFKDLTENNNKGKSSSQNTMFGTGYSLATTNVIDLDYESRNSQRSAAQELRDIWAKKYPTPPPIKNTVNLGASSSKAANDGDNEKSCSESKKRRICTLNDDDNGVKDSWTVVDDEVMIKDNNASVISILSSSDEEDNHDDGNENETSNDDDNGFDVKDIKIKKENACRKTSTERQREIKQEILETSDLIENDLTEDDIELIDDEYDDNFVLNKEINDILTDTSLIDDLFGEDTLLRDFNNENAVVSSDTRYHKNSNKDIIVCPICEERVTRENLSGHLDGCSGITVKVIPAPSASTLKSARRFSTTAPSSTVVRKDIPSTSKSSFHSDISDDTIFDISGSLQQNQLTSSSPSSSNVEESEAEGRLRRRGLVTSTHSCPVCAQEVDVDRINEHLDICLKS